MNSPRTLPKGVVDSQRISNTHVRRSDRSRPRRPDRDLSKLGNTMNFSNHIKEHHMMSMPHLAHHDDIGPPSKV